jgi:choline-sulfatase
MFRSLSLLGLALAAVGGLLMLSPARAASPAPNVILILVDALRADKLGPYGYTARPTTPNLTRFASRGVVFENTISQAAWTVPSVASLFTGVDPQAHRVLRYNQSNRVEMDALSMGHQTIAEQFKGSGYSTAAIMKSIVVDSGRGFSQGFDTFTVVNPKQNQADGDSGRELTDASLAWIDQQKSTGKPFFAYLHYMDSHSPYKAPEPYYSKYRAPGYAGPVSGAHMQIENDYKKPGVVPAPADIQQALALYDAEIEYWDAQFGRLMQALVANGIDANTIVVVTADHGEAFWEHGTNVFHEHLYQENIHIPFIIKGPGVKPGRYSHWTQSIDIAPTLADLAGVPKGAHWQGRSQAPVLKGTGPAVVLPVYSEYSERRTIIDPSGMKLLLGDPSGPMLFDLKKDPGEKTNLAASQPDVVNRLKGLLEVRTAEGKALAATFPAEEKNEMSPEQVQQLCALGYLSGAVCEGK